MKSIKSMIKKILILNRDRNKRNKKKNKYCHKSNNAFFIQNHKKISNLLKTVLLIIKH